MTSNPDMPKNRYRPLRFALGLCAASALALGAPFVASWLWARKASVHPTTAPTWSARVPARPSERPRPIAFGRGGGEVVVPLWNSRAPGLRVARHDAASGQAVEEPVAVPLPAAPPALAGNVANDFVGLSSDGSLACVQRTIHAPSSAHGRAGRVRSELLWVDINSGGVLARHRMAFDGRGGNWRHFSASDGRECLVFAMRRDYAPVHGPPSRATAWRFTSSEMAPPVPAGERDVITQAATVERWRLRPRALLWRRERVVRGEPPRSPGPWLPGWDGGPWSIEPPPLERQRKFNSGAPEPSGSSRAVLSLRDEATGARRQLRTGMKPAPDEIARWEWRPALSRDGQFMAATLDGYRDGLWLCVWKWKSGRLLWSTKIVNCSRPRLTFSPDNRLLAVGGVDWSGSTDPLAPPGRLLVFDARGGQLLLNPEMRTPAEQRSQPEQVARARWSRGLDRALSREAPDEREFLRGDAGAVLSLA